MSAGGKDVAGEVGFGVVDGVMRVGGDGQGQVGDAVEFLAGEEMVVPLEKDGHAGVGHDLLDGPVPAGTVRGKARGVAPFKGIGHFDAAAPGAVDVVGKDEFVAGGAVLECLAEPLVLRVAEGDVPKVAVVFASVAGAIGVVHGFGGVPVGVDNHKQCIAPGEGVIVSQLADVLDRFRVAGVEVVGGRQGVVGVAGSLRPDRHVIRCAVEVGEGGLFVVAIDQVDGRFDQPQPLALVDVQLCDGISVDILEAVHAEIVADGQKKVGLIGGDTRQGADVQVRIELFSGALRVRVANQVEGEGAAGRALGDEGMFRSGRAIVADAVVVARVWLETVEQRFEWYASRSGLRDRLGGVHTGSGAVLVVEVHSDGWYHIDGHRYVRRAAEDLLGEKVR